MIVFNPPAVPPGTPVRSTRREIQMVEMALLAAGVRYSLPGEPGGSDPFNDGCRREIYLLDLQIGINILSGNRQLAELDSRSRSRLTGRVEDIIVDGEDGLKTLTEMFAGIAPASPGNGYPL